jgi:hypothetical protein
LSYHATACCHDQHIKGKACHPDHALEQHTLQYILQGSDARLKKTSK